jgi:hypothetical protein
MFSKLLAADPMARSDRLFGPAVPGFAVSPSVTWRPEKQAPSGRVPAAHSVVQADSRPGLTQRARHFTYRRAEYKRFMEKLSRHLSGQHPPSASH